MKKLPLLSLFIIFNCSLSISKAQTPDIDSLKAVAENQSFSDTTRIYAKGEWAYALRNISLDSLKLLSEQTLLEAENLNYFNGIGMAKKGLGRYWAERGDYGKAVSIYKEALKSFQKAKNEKQEGRTYILLGGVNRNLGNYQQALNYLQKAISISEKINDKSGLANSFNNIGIVHYYWGNYDQAIDYYQQAIEIFKELGKKRGVATAFNNIGIVHVNWGNYGRAIDYYKQSIEIKEELGNKRGVAIALLNLGVVHNNWGNYARAIDYYQQSLEIFKELGHKRGMAIDLSNIGNVHSNWGNYDRAIDYYQQSLEIRKELGDKSGVANTLNNIGETLLEQERYAEALVKFEEALTISHENEVKSEIAQSNYLLGTLYFAQNEHAKALEKFKKALSLHKVLNEKGKIATDYAKMGELHFALGNYNLAIENSQKALEIAEETGQKEDIETASGVLAKCYARQGAYEKAYSYHVLHKQMHDSIFSKESRKKINAIESSFELERKETKIQLQQAELEKKKTEIQQQKTKQYALAGVLLGSLLILGLVILGYIRTKKARRLISKQKDEIQATNQKLNQTNEELNLKNKQLQELIEEQNGMMRVVAHDLKSPLSNIYYSLKMLERGKKELSDKENKYHTIIYKEIEGGLNLIKDLTDIHKAEELQSEMKVEKTEIEEFVYEIIELQREKAEVKEIKIHYNAKLLYPKRNVEQDFLRRIIENLLSNAIKFSPFERNVYVELSDTADNLIISVKDEGPGFSEKDKEKVFKKFQKLSARPTNKEYSSGLGLSIVKALTERLNGTIELISEEGKGALFIVNIPGKPSVDRQE